MPTRSPIFGNPIPDARRRADLLLDVEELARFIRDEHPEQIDGRLAGFDRDQWILVMYKGLEQPSYDSALRTFERWKTKVKPLGVLTDSQRDEPYAIDLDALERELPEALRLSEATPRAPRREVPITQVFSSLGIGYSQGKIAAWIKLGMPVRVQRRGSRDFYFGDIDEVESWVKKAVVRGVVLDPFRPKMPLAEAAEILRGARAKLGLTVSRMAKLVGTTPGQLNSYMGLGTYGKWVPADVVLKARELLRTGVEQEKKAMRHGSPTLADTRRAIESTHGRLTDASRALVAAGYTIGVSPKHLGWLAEKYGIPFFSPKLVFPSDEELKALLKANRYRIYRTAADLGMSGHALGMHIERTPELAALVATHGHGRITRQDIVDAAEASGFRTTEAARLVDISPDRFRRLLHQHGLREWYSSRGMIDLGQT